MYAVVVQLPASDSSGHLQFLYVRYWVRIVSFYLRNAVHACLDVMLKVYEVASVKNLQTNGPISGIEL